MDVAWLILADAAEVANNKLYLIGGGWETLTIDADLPHVHSFAVAIALDVPWSETDRRHNVSIVVLDPSGVELVDIAGQVEVRMPAGAPRANTNRVQMAISVALPVQQLGSHDVVVRVEAHEVRRAPFQVVAGSNLASHDEA